MGSDLAPLFRHLKTPPDEFLCSKFLIRIGFEAVISIYLVDHHFRRKLGPLIKLRLQIAFTRHVCLISAGVALTQLRLAPEYS